MAWLILTKDGKPYPSARYPDVVEEDAERPGRYTVWSGIFGQSGTLLPDYAVRPAKNEVERQAVASAEAQHQHETADSFQRWTKRDGLVVEWGNTVTTRGGVFQGQAFRETFDTEAEAI